MAVTLSLQPPASLLGSLGRLAVRARPGEERAAVGAQTEHPATGKGEAAAVPVGACVYHLGGRATISHARLSVLVFTTGITSPFSSSQRHRPACPCSPLLLPTTHPGAKHAAAEAERGGVRGGAHKSGTLGK